MPLERRTLDLLCYLATHPQRPVTRDELLSHLGQVSALSQGVLANTMAKVHKALGQAAKASWPIETVRGRCYRIHALAHAPEPERPAACIAFALDPQARERGRSAAGALRGTATNQCALCPRQ